MTIDVSKDYNAPILPQDDGTMRISGWNSDGDCGIRPSDLVGKTTFTATGGTTARSAADRGSDRINVLDFSGIDPTGSSDSTSAIEAALALGASTGRTVEIPGGVYLCDDVEVPGGVRVEGSASRFYGTVLGGAILRRKTSATKILNIGTNEGVVFQGITFDGMDRTADGIYGTPQHILITQCNFINCNVGVGGVGQYFKTADIISNHFFGCNYGVRSTIDSRISDNFFADCYVAGISQQTGANDNIISNNKIEWCRGYGVELYVCEHTVISGNVFDRNYKVGVKCTSANYVKINDNMMRRNGRNDSGLYGEDTHIFIEGCAHVDIRGNLTRIGADDGGGGTTTPKYSFVMNVGCDYVSVEGNDLTGCTTATPLVETAIPSHYEQSRNHGVREWRSVGSYQITTEGKHREGVQFTESLTTGNSQDLTFSGLYPLAQYSRLSRQLIVTLRDSTSGASYGASIMLVFSREGAGTTIIASPAAHETTATGVISFGATSLQLTVGTVATDGSSAVINVKNNGGDTVSAILELM